MIPKILEILQRAVACEIEEKRCLILTQEQFWQVVSLMNAANMEMRDDDKLSHKHGFHNFELILSQSDEHPYFVCCKAERMLDTLWEAKTK